MLAKRRDNCRQELKNIAIIYHKIGPVQALSNLETYHETNHNFDWEKVNILDFEKKRKRNISEMIHFKEQKNSLNLMKDTELLDNSYFNILDDIREHKWSQF